MTVQRRFAVSLALLALAACGGSGGKAFRPLAMGDPAPAYATGTLKGDSVDLAKLRGRPVLLNVWATWCIPCRHEMPAIQQLYTAFADSGLVVIGVSVDENGSDGQVRQFAEDHGVTFTIARDPAKRVQRIFRTIGVPETFLIDRKGKIAHRWIGEFEPASEPVRQAVHEVLHG